ncbi:MAG: T9SS type A sorting domain-containing protein [candidate division Zixibacteria bacterium]|nr:T9SS type A sorting domain-containing protein [candidate division Zixibacteria bacterium]
MKIQISVFIRIIAFLVLLTSIASGQGTLVDTSFYSVSLVLYRNVDVYLPEGYDPDGSIDYPVVYFLHGAGGNQNTYPEIIDVLDTLIENQHIEPVIVVKPNGHIGPYAGSMYTNSELYGNFEDYIVYDLIDFIETSFRAIPEAEKRCVMGHSMGGIGSMKLALIHSDIYAGVAALSGALDLNIGTELWLPHIRVENGGSPPFNYSPFAGTFTLLTFTAAGAFSPNLDNPPFFVDFPLDTNGNMIDSVVNRWFEHNPANLASSLPQESDLSIYFDCGTWDHLEFYPMNTAFADTLDNLGIAYEFQSFGGDHYDPARLPIGLMFLDSIMHSTTEIADNESDLPESFILSQNYPNPFNANTTISYNLPTSSEVTLEIYDILGRKVRTLQNGIQAAGSHSLIWNADSFSSGTYFYRLTAGEYERAEKMILLK